MAVLGIENKDGILDENSVQETDLLIIHNPFTPNDNVGREVLVKNGTPCQGRQLAPGQY
jgi:hypothetical protein